MLMKYNYWLSNEFSGDEAREALKELASKDEETALPKTIVESHAEMVQLLRQASEGNKHIDPRVLDAIEKIDRTDFFDWDALPADIKEKVVTPYCFMAPVFSDEQTIPDFNKQTIPSPHMVLSQASFLDLKDGQKILEIGTRSGYNAAIVAEVAGENSELYSVEENPFLVEYASEKIDAVGLGDRVHVLQAEEGVLGAPKYAHFDRIYSTIAAVNTSQVEALLDQLEVGGLMRLSVVKRGNTSDKEKSVLWTPGNNFGEDEMFCKDPARGMYRQATYAFRKIDEDNIEYSVVISNAIGPIFK